MFVKGFCQQLCSPIVGATVKGSVAPLFSESLPSFSTSTPMLIFTSFGRFASSFAFFAFVAQFLENFDCSSSFRARYDRNDVTPDLLAVFSVTDVLFVGVPDD